MLRVQESWIYLKNSALAVVDLRNSKGKRRVRQLFFFKLHSTSYAPNTYTYFYEYTYVNPTPMSTSVGSN